MHQDNIPRDGGIQENNNERRNGYNLNRRHYYAISLIFVILAVTYQFSPTSETIVFTFEEFIKYAEKFGYAFDIFKLPSNEEINQNIVNCTSLALRIEQSVAFNDTGPELVMNLNDFSSKLEIAKSSYTKMYSDGAWFIWNFEQFINYTLNYVSNDSFMSTITRRLDPNLQNSIKGSIEALDNFLSSVEEAYEATSTAESFRSGTHKQVIKAKDEVQRFIENINNPSYSKRIRDLIDSVTDTTKVNALKVDNKIATEIESFLTYLDDDLNRVKSILLKFKENLGKHKNFLRQLEAGIEPIKQLKWNEHEINQVRELLNMIKENHKNFKSRVNQ
ncbi:hypothetical protein RhiirA1_495844 [Rhizophagus irregularis]|uniref:Uncharacterized protein n=3 Tax=Rhizophagus irregularis TaxID=588596 RepID=A0A2I1E217_9GLOM|nr:hypothetical protein RirG_253200 [Rhizophagus irregularis DAOM 197198w]PKC71672.1 hypothetical protein RhiirA1_495844 [Rhizophagus irregularis]GET60146.1 hypothetical protein GLOIN_2v89380 [Rhizophagus irregularis DAOM 181602=DAOM 197198]PKK76276.1 hypothetical protein RhiirC2_772657 [Rhizophagus irregularis]PKY16141.1 hypothetical protein RhiirB3_27615 [Rhizophagus irregularis]